jgi:tRNA A-37 threonylcarbamoyl transferase component Bud32
VALSVDPRIGTKVLDYRVESLIGRGGMSAVYLAEDLALRRRVALKLLAPALADDAAFRARFLEESQLAASLDHPNVVPIYEAGQAGDELYIAMRFVEGMDLKQLLRDGPLEPEHAVRICGQVADALDFAHERGLVHRDVKPSNVLLDPKEHVYLADFGLTKRLGEGRSVEPGLFGTIDYVAPEQIRGDDIDGRADVYALGCLLYECLAGTAPFRRGSDAATLYAHLEDAPPRLPGLEDVLPKALAKEPEDRYQTCAELIDDVRDALGIAQTRRSLWPVAVAAVGLAVVAAALLAFFLTRGGGPAPTAQEGRLLEIDPSSNRVTSSIAVGDGPAAVAAGSGRVWVASYRDGSLWLIDPGTGAVTKVPSLGRPYALTLHGGKTYVAALGPAQFAGNVAQFDAVTGGHTGGVDKFACSLTGGAYGIWVAGCPDVQKLEIDGGDVRLGRTGFRSPSRSAPSTSVKRSQAWPRAKGRSGSSATRRTSACGGSTRSGAGSRPPSSSGSRREPSQPGMERCGSRISSATAWSGSTRRRTASPPSSPSVAAPAEWRSEPGASGWPMRSTTR